MEQSFLEELLRDQVIAEEKMHDIISVEDLRLANKKDQRYSFAALPYDPECNPTRAFMVNDAQLNTISSDVSTYKINWEDDKKEKVSSVQVSINNLSAKLSDIFFELPYGIIKKNITGIGATTLELRSQRNSIIVTANKALAYSKYLTGNDERLGKNKYLYVGSKINNTETTDADIKDYLEDKEIEHKKIIVVANSLGRIFSFKDPYVVVYDEENDCYRSCFFLMVDEIDEYQSDGTYRPELEDVIDYFLKFPACKRALVSATIRPFSNPQLQELPIIELNYPDPIRRDIKLIHTNNLHLTAKKIIEDLFKTTDQKIVVAYNRITSILQIIDSLSDESKTECGILCSQSSKDKAGDYYCELNERNLSQRISFITSSYFSGIDINDRFHLISISNTDWIYTSLSPEKLQQIAGRCRDAAGVFSETIIYNTAETDESCPETEKLQTYYINYAKDLSEFANSADTIVRKYPRLVDENFLEVKNDVVNRSKKSYFGSQPISLIRTDINKVSTVSYFNIDAIIEYFRLRRELYVKPESLKEHLERQHNIIGFENSYIEITEEQKAQEKAVEARLEELEQNAIASLVARIQEQGRITTIFLSSINRDANPHEKKFIKRFLRLYKYIPKDQLVIHLQENHGKNEVWYRGFYNAAIFWCLDAQHPFRISIQTAFPIGKIFSRDEASNAMQSVINQYYKGKKVEYVTAIKILNMFCETRRGNNRGTTYRIVSYNPYNFTGTPLRVINPLEPVNLLFDLRL